MSVSVSELLLLLADISAAERLRHLMYFPALDHIIVAGKNRSGVPAKVSKHRTQGVFSDGPPTYAAQTHFMPCGTSSYAMMRSTPRGCFFF